MSVHHKSKPTKISKPQTATKPRQAPHTLLLFVTTSPNHHECQHAAPQNEQIGAQSPTAPHETAMPLYQLVIRESTHL